jgi:hypothetical protein
MKNEKLLPKKKNVVKHIFWHIFWIFRIVPEWVAAPKDEMDFSV